MSTNKCWHPVAVCKVPVRALLFISIIKIIEKLQIKNKEVK
jgi:hypothetical protein